MLESSLSDPGVDTKYFYLVLLAEITESIAAIKMKMKERIEKSAIGQSTKYNIVVKYQNQIYL